MTAKEFLRSVRGIDRRIDETTERLDRIRARLESGRMSNLSGMPRGGTLDWTETADRVIELERRVNGQVREMCKLKHAAMDAIDAVVEVQLREVLELYYLDGLTWDQVAERMGLDRRWVFRLHGKALLRVTVPREYV